MVIKMKDWLVYKHNDKIDAVEYEWTFEQYYSLQLAGCEIIGCPAAREKEDAIEYIKQITA